MTADLLTRDGLDGYRALLVGRDGDADLLNRSLSRRDEFFSRLLGDVLDMFDLPFQVVPPSPLMRQLVKTAVFVPRRLAAPFVGAAEMAGCAMFALLGARGVELFADEPAVAARIRLLYNEILTDEIGHVGYCAASSTPGGRRAMRRLYPLIGRYVIHGTPELALTLGRDEIRSHLDAPFDLDSYAAQVDVRPFIAEHP